MVHKVSNFITNERLLRFIEDGDVAAALDEPLGLPVSRQDKLRQVFERTVTQDNVISAVTLGSFLFDYLRINPLVVEGVDFAHKEQFNSLFDFAVFAGRRAKEGLLGSNASLNRIKGFVAERFAAWDLQAKGHEITWPEMSNNPGWDILVDGNPFQIKCVTDPSEVWTHLRKYPDIPAYVNVEVGDHFQGQDNVHILPGFSEKKVLGATKDTLTRGARLTRFQVPWVSLMVVSGTSIAKVVTGKTDLQAAFLTTAVDVGSRTFLGSIGRAASASAGSLLFGPAGWIIGQQVGQVLGARLGKPLAGNIKAMFTKEKEGEVYRGVSSVLAGAAAHIDTKIDCKDEKEDALSGLVVPSRANSYVKGMLKEEFQEDKRYLRNKKTDMQAYAKDCRGLAPDPVSAVEQACIITTQAGVHPHVIQTEWKSVAQALRNLERERVRFGLQAPH